MVASLEQSIREAVMQYIAGRVQLREFQEWFASKTWDMGSESQDVQQLVNEIDLLLAEFLNGHWTEGELRSKLQQYRRVVLPIQAVGGILWSDVRGAPYVYVPTSSARGYGATTYPGFAEPAPNPQIPKIETSSPA